ncbi:geranylgeranyl diphosphate synthase, type I [Limimonas halophila]|uniref:Geranylgeranyl diphosphate synthase, type I n=1 Tax=Limimonas halophila TaxID=1082479 RepID=A0A1G7QQI6_9PROT|nr:polyprenyl synthetase family protein [Limimonas halophila]SDG00768.1 geranylgeranyl diphosphate synthase, type I [Limimonas halophila]
MTGNADTPLEAALAQARTQAPAVEARLRTAWADTPLAAAGAAHDAAGGKRSRVRLTLTAAALLGCDARDAEAAAAAVELLHNASLVHDDLIDEDATRRGVPSVWKTHGTAGAVLLGDRLLAAAHAEAAATGAPRELVQALSATARRLVDGVARERAPAATAPGDAARDAYLDLARDKSGALFAFAVDAALILAGVPHRERHVARTAFEALGAAYQIGDDLADLDGHKLGRPAGGDVAAARLCAPVAALRALGEPATVAAFDRFLAAPEDAEIWIARLRGADVRAEITGWRDGLMGDAASAAARLRPELRAFTGWAATAIGGPAPSEEAPACAAATP